MNDITIFSPNTFYLFPCRSWPALLEIESFFPVMHAFRLCHQDSERNEQLATCLGEWCSDKLKFHLARLDSTRHIRRVEPMHFGCVELVEQHTSTRSTRRARLARLARHVELDRRYLQLSYDQRNSFIV